MFTCSLDFIHQKLHFMYGNTEHPFLWERILRALSIPFVRRIENPQTTEHPFCERILRILSILLCVEVENPQAIEHPFMWQTIRILTLLWEHNKNPDWSFMTKSWILKPGHSCIYKTVVTSSGETPQLLVGSWTFSWILRILSILFTGDNKNPENPEHPFHRV